MACSNLSCNVQAFTALLHNHFNHRLMMDDIVDDFIVDEELLTDALANGPVETDEEQSARLKTDIEKCSDGAELYRFMNEKLPVCGQKFGSSLSMNRALTTLKAAKLIDDKHPTWASCKKSHKDAVELIFGGLLATSPTFISLKSSVLEGFIAKKSQGKAIKPRAHQTLILEDQAEPTNLTGRSVDRIALLACALVDPELNHMFTTMAAPIDAAVRPAFLDLGAIHVTLSRWTGIAEAVMARREGYFNPFKEVCITGHGKVLSDIDPSKGVFHTTASTPMGKQFKELLTTLRELSRFACDTLFYCIQSVILLILGTQNMLLNERIYKSGYNSESVDLVDSAYLRTGCYTFRY